MQYHTVSLADMPGASVSLVGYTGEECIAAVEDHECVRKCLISPPSWTKKLPRSLFLLVAPLKVIQQILQLFWVLLVVVSPPDAILVQNPPAIPALMVRPRIPFLIARKADNFNLAQVVWIVSILRGCVVVVDWHNLGYTVLAENSLGASHPVVSIARWYEQLFGSRFGAHLCVTRSFRGWLKDTWGIEAVVLYDKPPDFFQRTPLETRHDLFTRLRPNFKDVEQKLYGTGSGKAGETLFTTTQAGQTPVPQLRSDRPALLISSTSWTPDEDFGLLLDALVALDRAWVQEKTLSGSKTNGGSFPHLVVVVTGKGPQRAMYEARIAELQMHHVTVKTMWLEAADYPLLLGAADLGVCLHTSTSNLDLPMKVVDMFGCGLPVCAVGFDCLAELVRHDFNGLVFDNSEQLAVQCEKLLAQFPADCSELQRLSEGVEVFGDCRWQDNCE